MKDEKETKEKLLASAKIEFMEKGYQKASLRSICKNAGVTTGALYFFFQGKEDLFASLVEEPLHKLYNMMLAHYQEELDDVNHGMESSGNHIDDRNVALAIVTILYQHYDEFSLILSKSEGTYYEACVDQFVKITEKHYTVLANRIVKLQDATAIDPYIIHWLAHMQIDAFVHLLTHNVSQQDAVNYMETIVQYMIAGWYGVFHPKNK